MAETYGTGGGEKKAEETDDIAGRFPSVETDERLRTPRGRDLPEPPQREFTPPTLPQVEVMRPDAARMGGVAGSGLERDELRGAGIAAGAGIQLVVAIIVCTGLGWAVDRFLLKSSGTPWGLIVGFMLGVGSGFMNLFRLTAQLGRDEGKSSGGGSGTGT